MQNQGGYSPNKLVLDRNVNIPMVLTNKAPAYESVTSKDIIHKNFIDSHNAHRNFIKAESDERIR